MSSKIIEYKSRWPKGSGCDSLTGGLKKSRELRRFPQCGWNCHVLTLSNLCEEESLGVFAPEAIKWPLLSWNTAKTCWKFGPPQGPSFELKDKSQVEASFPLSGRECAMLVLLFSYVWCGGIPWLEGLYLGLLNHGYLHTLPSSHKIFCIYVCSFLL